jgi:hypothetical protein
MLLIFFLALIVKLAAVSAVTSELYTSRIPTGLHGLHDLPTSLSYILYQTVTSTPKHKKLPRLIMKTNRSVSENI